jgi:plasmid stability protein
MVSALKVRLTDKQRKALSSRARTHGSSLSAEMREAIDLYLEFPLDFEDKCLAALTEEASATLNRSIAKLDNAITHRRTATGSLSS